MNEKYFCDFEDKTRPGSRVDLYSGLNVCRSDTVVRNKEPSIFKEHDISLLRDAIYSNSPSLTWRHRHFCDIYCDGFLMGSRADWPIIGPETTVKTVAKLHRKVWDHVVKTGRKPVDLHVRYLHACPICEYSARRRNPLIGSVCDYCPSNLRCHEKGSLFDQWMAIVNKLETTVDSVEREALIRRSTELAIQIRDVEIKEKDDENGRGKTRKVCAGGCAEG